MTNGYDTVGARVSAVLSELKNLKKISGDVEIATLLGYKSASSITEMKKGRAMPTTEFLELLKNRYGVNPEYIIEGKDPRFLSNRFTFEKGGLDFLRDYTERILSLEATVRVLLLDQIEIRKLIDPTQSFSDISLALEHRIKQAVQHGLAESRMNTQSDSL